MKKYIFIILILLFLLRVINVIINDDRIKLDGFFAEIESSFFFDDTKYSGEYTHGKYLKIKLGMTENEVLEILGKPLATFKPHEHSKKYKYLLQKSKSFNLYYPNDTSLIKHNVYVYSFHPSRGYYYRMRHICFDENKKVNNIINCFYTQSD